MMKHFICAVAIVCLAPLLAYPQTESPPISQPLVSEGAFALQLASALKLEPAATEAEAEKTLSSLGIAPQKGWVGDHPMTPLEIGEVRDSLLSAVDSGRLSMPRDEALKAFRGVTAQYGLDVFPASGGSAQYQPYDGSQYPGPDVINNYYYEQGPPAITYYPPPWGYSSLYSWYPYPFYGYGSFFPGFYILSDFGFFGGGGFFGRSRFDRFHGNKFRGSRFDHRFFGRSGFGRVDRSHGFRSFGGRRAPFFHRGSSPRIWDNFSNRNRIWSFNTPGSRLGFGGRSFNRGFSHGSFGRFGGKGSFGGRGSFGMSRGSRGSIGGFRGGFSGGRGGFGGGRGGFSGGRGGGRR